MTEPRTAAPSMNGRAMGITSQARTASPSETTAPARVPGTDTVPNGLGDVDRGRSAGRGVRITSLMDRLVLAGAQPNGTQYRLCVTRPTEAPPLVRRLLCASSTAAPGRCGDDHSSGVHLFSGLILGHEASQQMRLGYVLLFLGRRATS